MAAPLPMYESVYSMLATMSRVLERPVAPTEKQLSLLLTNLGLIRVGSLVRLDKQRIRSIALGEEQPDLASNLHYQELNKILQEVFDDVNTVQLPAVYEE